MEKGVGWGWANAGMAWLPKLFLFFSHSSQSNDDLSECHVMVLVQTSFVCDMLSSSLRIEPIPIYVRLGFGPRNRPPIWPQLIPAKASRHLDQLDPSGHAHGSPERKRMKPMGNRLLMQKKTTVAATTTMTRDDSSCCVLSSKMMNWNDSRVLDPGHPYKNLAPSGSTSAFSVVSIEISRQGLIWCQSLQDSWK